MRCAPPSDPPVPDARRRRAGALAALSAVVGVAVGLALASAAPVSGAEEAPAEDSPFENVRILTDVTSKSEMRRIMKAQAKALGVKCTHCHVPGRFHLDDKEAKRVGFEMMQMVEEINAKWFPDHEEPQVTCWTCHAGSLEPESVRPPEVGDDEADDAEDR